MKAAFCTKYGPPEVLQIQEVPTPIPKDQEILVKINASTVTMGDCELRGLTLPAWSRFPMRLYFGYNKPRNFIPGMEFSGVIEALGSKVSNFKVGDAVFGSSGMRMAANADYKIHPVKNAVVHKPAGISYQESATIIVGGNNALHFLRKANIQPGQKVLVNGAGGSIGTYGVQLAKMYGAEVTAIDSTEKLEMLEVIGADHVIDYTRQDFTSNGEKYDVIFDIVYGTPFKKYLESLEDDGCYLMANPSPGRVFQGLWIAKRTQQKIVFELAGEKPEDFTYLAKLLEQGKIKCVIDRTFPLEKIVEAHAYVESGQKKGNVIIQH